MSSSLFAAGRRATLARGAAALALIVGYLDLARGGITAAPVILIIAYVIIVPLAILCE